MKKTRTVAAKKEIEVGSCKKDSRIKAACGSKTMEENKESAETEEKDITFFVLKI